MNNILAAIILSLVQGFTEFLPISSTGHLVLIEKLLSFETFPFKVFLCITELGSLIALLSVYGRSLFLPIKSCLTDKRSRVFLLCIALAMLPATILGFLFHSYIKNSLYSPSIIALSLIAGGLIFLYLKRCSIQIRCSDTTHIKLWQAFLVGLAQSVALIPGISRSGATIASGLSVGMGLKTAIDFSFILAIPTHCGATLYELYKFSPLISLNYLPILFLGLIISCAASFIAIGPCIAFMKRRGLAPFGWYRIALGLLILLIGLY